MTFGVPPTFPFVPPAGKNFHKSSETSPHVLDSLAHFTQSHDSQTMYPYDNSDLP